MQLISSKDTLEFLSKVAPAAWVKRMLMWMMFEGDLKPYIVEGRIRSRAMKIHLLDSMQGYNRNLSAIETEKLIRSEFEYLGKDFINRMLDAKPFERFDGAIIEWDDSEDAHAVAFGYFLYSDNIDWQNGSVFSDFTINGGFIDEHLFWDEDEHIPRVADEDEWIAEFKGLSFDRDTIEMMLPMTESNFVSNGASISTKRKYAGRPSKWNWEGAMTSIVSQAQHPDGLPVGHGAQAKIEKMIENWFVDETGEAPATSQIRVRASKIMNMVNNINSPK